MNTLTNISLLAIIALFFVRERERERERGGCGGDIDVFLYNNCYATFHAEINKSHEKAYLYVISSIWFEI
jgi:hypothetical protein